VGLSTRGNRHRGCASATHVDGGLSNVAGDADAYAQPAPGNRRGRGGCRYPTADAAEPPTIAQLRAAAKSAMPVSPPRHREATDHIKAGAEGPPGRLWPSRTGRIRTTLHIV
jgi:hypothetical protein